jgi:hypothetical protein
MSLDRRRRILIVRSLIFAFIGLAIAYLIPEVLGLVEKLKSQDASIRPWEAAMRSIPIRIVHIVGLVITLIALICTFRLWSLRFTALRDGET